MSHKDGWTGDAWLSSVRDLNCSLKWGNERNPYCLLYLSGETAALRRKERMTPSQHVPLMSWATHMLQWPVQWAAKPKGGANPIKAGLSSDLGLQLDLMKLEL